MPIFCNSPFWDTNHILNSTSPDLTECFQQTALSWAPCFYLLIVLGPYVQYLRASRYYYVKHTALNITKTILVALLICMCAIDVAASVFELIQGYVEHIAHIITPCVQLLAMILSVVLIQLGRRHGVRSSGPLFIYWLLQLIVGVLILQSRARKLSASRTSTPALTANDIHLSIAEYGWYPTVWSSWFVLLVLVQLILASLVEKEYQCRHVLDDRMNCPELCAPLLSVITFWWVTGLVIKGYKRDLIREDLWDLKPSERSSVIVPTFKKYWRKQIDRCCVNRTAAIAASAAPNAAANVTTATTSEEESQGGAGPGSSRKDQGSVGVRSALLSTGSAESRTCEAGEIQAVGRTYCPKLWLALAKTFYKRFLLGALFKLCHDIFQFFNPLLLEKMIDFVNDTSQPVWLGYCYSVLLFAVAFIQSIALHQYFHHCMTVGLSIRTALVAAIYEKSLRLSNSARCESDSGEVVNLMAVDAQRFLELTTYLNTLWSGPLQILVTLVLLYLILGPSVFAGLLVMVLLIPLNVVITRQIKKIQIDQMRLKDARIKLMNEILSGIKVLKLYAWEPSFEDKVGKIREQELRLLRKTAYLQAVTSFAWTCAPFMVSLATFAVYVLSSPDNVLDAKKAFVSICLFNILRFPLLMFPALIINIAQAKVSLRRIQKFLLNEELDMASVDRSTTTDDGRSVLIENGTFAWDLQKLPVCEITKSPKHTRRCGCLGRRKRNKKSRRSSSSSLRENLNTSNASQARSHNLKMTLHNIHLSVPRGALIAVVGPVGCGKSSLFSAILGEMMKLQGNVNVKGSVAYVAQQAWIQNTTVKLNILFGRRCSDSYYERIIDACALRPDLNILHAGDQTEIGEKGINLSGGQKQRISLARAVYAQAEVYLLDDPLSAVDSHVGKQLFDKVISHAGILCNKTRILVTHSLRYLPMVDEIVVMDNGRIVDVGHYDDLLQREGPFARFLRMYVEQQAKTSMGRPSVTAFKDDDEMDEEMCKHLASVVTDYRQLRECLNLARQRRKEKEEQQSKSADVSTAAELSAAVNRSPAAVKRSPAAVRRSSAEIYDSSAARYDSPAARYGSSAALQDSADLDLSAAAESWAESKLRESREVIGCHLPPDDACSISESAVSEEVGGNGVGGERKRKEGGDGESRRAMGNQEEVASGRVSLSVFKLYMSAVGVLLCVFIIFTHIINNALSVGANFWLSEWSNDVVTSAGANISMGGADKRNMRLGVYGALGVGQGLTEMLCSFIMGGVFAVRAARFLHRNLVSSLLHAELSFYDLTPVGRPINRLTSDMAIVDHVVPFTVRSMINSILGAVITLSIVAYATPLYLTTLLPLIVVYLIVQRLYISTSRQLKRLESVSRSPIYSHFGETLQGASTIRAFGADLRFIAESESRVDNSQTCLYATIVANRWLALRLEFVGNCLVFFAALFAVIGRDSLSAGIVGLSITYALNVTQVLNWMVRMTSELETNIVAVERIKEYTEVQREAAWRVPGKTPHGWPGEGAIVFKHYTTRYRPGLEPVLVDISCAIKAAEKVGIVGRTGAGKSSLTLALLRVIEPLQGQIIIDDVDITTIGLHDLRSSLTIIPQDPVLFAGSLRMNIDPLNEYTDEQVFTAVDGAHLTAFLQTLPFGLGHECTEGGQNLSVGQRQLVCLARALLRKSRVLIMDEATAAVDVETDDLIQRTVREEFEHCTILTIAHRINTIIDYDRIIVLDKGKLVEMDTPKNLLDNKASLFYTLAQHAGLVQ